MSKLYKGSGDDAVRVPRALRLPSIPEAGMRVESSKTFSVLAHELRSPLGVIQGYLRMLRMRRTDDDPELRMLTAMLDATGRISTVANQASELAIWHDGQPSGVESDTTIGTLLNRVAASRDLLRPVTVEAGVAATLAIRTSQPAAVAAAVAALANAAARSAPDQAIGIRSVVDANGSGVILIGPEPALAALNASSMDEADPGRARDRLFSCGGQGLALILAAAVFERHGVVVGLIESAADVIVVRLPKDRGRP